MIFMTTWQNSNSFLFLVLSKANVTPVIDGNIYKDLEEVLKMNKDYAIFTLNC